MNRLEKKCLLGSASLHGLLVVSFLVGSAFLPQPQKNVRPQAVEIVPYDALSKVTDDPSRGGGPAVTLSPALVRPLAPPAPELKAERREESVKLGKLAPPKARDPKRVRDDPDPIQKAPGRDLDRLTNTVVKSPALAKPEEQEKFERAQAAWANRLQALAGALGKAERGLSQGFSGKVVTTVGPSSPSGKGEAAVNWRDAVADSYTRAWEPPQNARDSAKTGVEITIARDGTVVNRRITRPSGDSALDQSVERVLQEVKSVPAFPEGAAEARRTLNITFDLTVKRFL